ncbi:MAG TPA: GIY-YIG nuclease family protein [Candidatus Dojkabacteria bacterium]|nr:GIY-YIG nuclease family protein [Candidatus Dojkabacteria bacterium]
MTSGVYIILNIKNNKCYIGSSSRCVYKRMNDHKTQLVLNKHKNTKLQNAFNKYQLEAFSFEVIAFCKKDRCIEVEQKWIDFYKSYLDEFGYNIESIAGSSLGTKRTKKQKDNISKSLKGKRFGKNNNRYGKHWSAEQKNRFRKSMPHSKPVIQIDKTTKEIIAEFESIRQAANSLNVDKSPISKVCKKLPKFVTAYGYIWEYKTI